MSTNREVEIKLRVRDVEKLVADLAKLGARKTARVFEHNALFDTEDGLLRQQHAILRIRREQNASSNAKTGGKRARKQNTVGGVLTFKCLLKRCTIGAGKYKERKEVECCVGDADQLARILEGVGMRPWFEYEKYRTKYGALDGALHFDLDETPIGTFLELEGPKRAIDRAAQALGYSASDYITASYLELYCAECGRRRLKVANMVFNEKKKP